MGVGWRLAATGHNLTVTHLELETFEGPLRSETRRPLKFSSSAFADVQMASRLGLQCPG